MDPARPEITPTELPSTVRVCDKNIHRRPWYDAIASVAASGFTFDVESHGDELRFIHMPCPWGALLSISDTNYLRGLENLVEQTAIRSAHDLWLIKSIERQGVAPTRYAVIDDCLSVSKHHRASVTLTIGPSEKAANAVTLSGRLEDEEKRVIARIHSSHWTYAHAYLGTVLHMNLAHIAQSPTNALAHYKPLNLHRVIL
jgi:hypothetical protein